MLQQIKAWETAQDWASIRQSVPGMLEHLAGDELARAYLSLSKAFEESAATPAEYREAVRLSVIAVESASPQGFLHTWCLARAANMLADLGQFGRASELARLFLVQVQDHPKAAPMAPYAYYALGRSRYYARKPVEAMVFFRLGLASAEGEIKERTLLWLAWALAGAGRIQSAFSVIPHDAEGVSKGHILAAVARVCYAAGDWAGALTNARAAISTYDAGEWRLHDFLQAAELTLIRKHSACRLQCSGQALIWSYRCANLLAPWSDELLFVIAPTLGTEGGERYEAADSSRGDAVGHKRCGLRGAIG